MSETPLISIITVNLNDLPGFERTIKSVLDQTWKKFEFIIVDGASSDGSKELIKTHEKNIDRWVSEPDRGIYNAMNKGIRMASGDYVLFLNSGDIFNTKNVLFQAAECLLEDFDIFYGDVQLQDHNKFQKKEVLVYPENLTFSFFCNSTLIHQAVFIKKYLFDKVFYYDEDLNFVSDWEFFICAICKYNASYKKLDFVVVDYDINGISSDPGNSKVLYKERDLCLKKHFPLIMEDYKELIDSRNKLKMPIVRSVLELEDYITARKVHRIVLNLLLKLSRFKNKALKK